tara:strand:+ start:1414 stop:2544 length:1131 start_codon:yes stop_codon:yes gene_type:complete
MILKIAIILVIISLFSSILYGTDRVTSENPSDAATIKIGLSSIDSSSCKICSEGGIFYDSGCKRCVQDSIALATQLGSERFYKLGWSNDNSVNYGDERCNSSEPSENFSNTILNENDTYWIEIVKDKLELKSSLYTDANFSMIHDSISMNMCSNPTNLQYVRVSNEDGKPPGNGGKLFGYIDDIKIYNKKISSENYDKAIFSTTFDECTNKSCNNKWVLQNPERIFVVPQKQHLQFLSTLTGTNDYAHFVLDTILPDSWTMRFKLHIDNIEPHPNGKGLLNIEPTYGQLIFGIPSFILPFISYMISREINSKFLGSLIVVAGIIILIGMTVSSGSLIQNLDSVDVIHAIKLTIITIIATLFIILGSWKIKKYTIRR